MRKFSYLIALLATLVFSMPNAYAVNPDEILSDPVLEQRARALSTKLRCLVCQNQSIDDSDASLAKDLRVLLRKRLVSGDSDEQVMDYVVSRYGEFVLLQPRWSAQTMLLWSLPFLLLLTGFTVLFRKARNPVIVQEKILSKDENKRITKLIREGD